MEPDQDQIPQYEIDKDTESLLATVIEMALGTANLQIDIKNAELVINICQQVAYRFGIELEIVQTDDILTDAEDLGGNLTVDNFTFKYNISSKNNNNNSSTENL